MSIFIYILLEKGYRVNLRRDGSVLNVDTTKKQDIKVDSVVVSSFESGRLY